MADATTTLTRPGFKPPILTPEQYAEAERRYLRGDKSADIAAHFNCKVTTLDSHFSRKGLPELRRESLKDGRGSRTRDKLAAISENIADQLLQKTPRGAISLNLYADTAQKAGKLADLVHGYSAQVMVGIVMAGDLGGRADSVEDQAIDIEEVPTNGQQDESKA